MAQALPVPPPGFDELSTEEKLSYVSALWDRVIADQDKLPVSDAHRELVRERLALHRANPQAARAWSDARRDIETLLRQRSAR